MHNTKKCKFLNVKIMIRTLTDSFNLLLSLLKLGKDGSNVTLMYLVPIYCYEIKKFGKIFL